jgi:hypothetical protein
VSRAEPLCDLQRLHEALIDLLRPVSATALGGICTLGVTLIWMYLFPKLRKTVHLSGVDASEQA